MALHAQAVRPCAAQPTTSEEMLAITNKYALAEDVTLDTREQKKETESGHWPSSSKGHDKKRNMDRSVNNVEWPRRSKEYRARPGQAR
jgi:hypothetical protein